MSNKTPKLKITNIKSGYYNSEMIPERKSDRAKKNISYAEPLSPDKRGSKLSPTRRARRLNLSEIKDLLQISSPSKPSKVHKKESSDSENISSGEETPKVQPEKKAKRSQRKKSENVAIQLTPRSSKVVGVDSPSLRQKAEKKQNGSGKGDESKNKLRRSGRLTPMRVPKTITLDSSIEEMSQDDDIQNVPRPVKKRRNTIAYYLAEKSSDDSDFELSKRKVPISSSALAPLKKAPKKTPMKTPLKIPQKRSVPNGIEKTPLSTSTLTDSPVKRTRSQTTVVDNTPKETPTRMIRQKTSRPETQPVGTPKRNTRNNEISVQKPPEHSTPIAQKKTPKGKSEKKMLAQNTGEKSRRKIHLNSNSSIIISESLKLEAIMKSLGLSNDPIIEDESYPPKCPVPCRENQFKHIFQFLISNIENKQSGCIYVSGVPGTGKTLICRTVVKILQKNRNISFDHVYINGLSLSTPDKLWRQLYKAVNGKNEKSISSQKALLKLDAHFKLSRKKKPFILIIDELDQLIEKNQRLLYNLFEWCDHDQSLFSVVSIFNTINLPEYFAARNISRMGLSRTTFAPYNSSELEEIISLEDYAKDLNADAKKLISRKVSSISGDVRRAKELARRAAEIVKTKALSDVRAVDDAFKEIFSSPKVDAIRDCSLLEQNFLRELSNDLEKNGLEVTTLKIVTTNLIKNAPLEGMSIVLDDVIRAFKNLSRLSLIEAENTHFLEKKIRLNVSPEDVKFALDKE